MKQQEKESNMLNKNIDRMEFDEEAKKRMSENFQETAETTEQAPDISQLDKEVNRLFALANLGVSSLMEFSPEESDCKTYRLNENGKFEARILCSTIVLNLHSHFKKEINMAKLADRYFLLLVDSITGDYPDDVVGFINSRIAFYNDSINIISKSPFSDAAYSCVKKIFTLLYLNPLSTIANDMEEEIVLDSITMHLKWKIIDVITELEFESLLITSTCAYAIKQQFLSLLTIMIPESNKELFNQDKAGKFVDLTIETIKSGNVNDKIISFVPGSVFQQIKGLSSTYNDQNKLSPEQFDIIFYNVKEEFIKTFSKEIAQKEEEKEEEKEDMQKTAFDSDPNRPYLCFSRMGGAGVIKCRDCGYEEEIISFTHGMMSCEIGRQCPNCHSFVVEHNESQEYHVMGKSEDDFVCPKCGAVIRKKEEHISKGNDDPLVCPKCQSSRLDYYMNYIT